MCTHWSEAKLFKFLRLYRRYECLWNPYSPEYKNCKAKSGAFSKILYEMNVFGLTINECLHQIKHIREIYKQEQQRLESLAFLGGRSYSNLLWYPLMNSMLSKVIQDEEKLNRAAGNLDLVLVPKRPPFNSGEQRSQKGLNPIEYGQMNSPWDQDETTAICPYLPNSNFGDYLNCYPNVNVSSNFNGMCAANEHISSCPTCGYSSGSSCNCFSMNNAEYHQENIEQNHSSYSQINYRPRTSYNYRNGMLEINSAVRIPMSQASPNCGYSNLIESIMPEEPEYNFEPIPSNHKPQMQTVEEEGEGFLTECCAKPIKFNNENNIVSDEYKCQGVLGHAADNNCNSSNLPSNKNDTSIKKNNWSLKKSKKTKKNIDEILRAKYNLLENQTKHDTQHSPRIESTKLFDTEQKNVTVNPPQPKNVNIKTEKITTRDINMIDAKVKVEQTSSVVSENQQPTKENILSRISRVKLRSNEDSIVTAECSQSKDLETDSKLNSPESGKTKTRGIVNYCNEKLSDVGTTQDIAQRSKSILKRKLTKIVIDFIDETLNKPDERLTMDAGDRLILKKVAKDLKALGNESNDKSMPEDYKQSKQNRSIKFCNKTICWREPIEESLNIVPCKSIRSSANKTKSKVNVVAGRSAQPNIGMAPCFRMMAGADVDNNIRQTNLFNRKDIRSKMETTRTGKCEVFNKNYETRAENVISPNCNEHLMIAMEEKQQHNDEEDSENVANIFDTEASQTNPEEYVLAAVKSVQAVNEVALDYSNSEVTRNKNLKLLFPNDIKNTKGPVIIDELCPAENSIDLDSQDVEIDERIMKMESNLDTKHCEAKNPFSTLQNVEIENGITIHVSVKTSENTGNETINKVVNKITDILRKALDKNGYAIDKKQFFTKKSLITNGNGEINRKLIADETVWKTELSNIIGDLMKHRKAADSISFKVKAMILPVTNQSNITAKGGANLTLSPNTSQRHLRSNKGLIGINTTCGNSKIETMQYNINIKDSKFKFEPNHMAQINDNIGITETKTKYEKPSRKLTDKTESRACNKEFKDLDSDVLLYESNSDPQFQKKLLKNQVRKSGRRKKNVTHSDKILMSDIHRIFLPYGDHPHGLWKLLKYIAKSRNKFQSIPKQYEKLLRKEQQGITCAVRNDLNFEQERQKNDSIAVADFCDGPPCNFNKDIEVYLCTEISQKDSSPMLKKIDCDYCSDVDVLDHDVNKNSISTSTSTTSQKHCWMKNTANSCVQKTARSSEEDASEWESFSDSEKDAEIVKHRWHQNKFNHQIPKRPFKENISVERYGLAGNLNQRNRYSAHDYLMVDTSRAQSYPEIHALSETTRDMFWYQKCYNKGELLDTIIKPTNKELKNMPNSQNHCKIVDIFSSNNQNIRQKELRSSEEGSETSLCRREFDETQEVNKYRIPEPNDSEEGQSLLEAKLKLAANNQTKSCCTGDGTGTVCTPICDVTSRLRLCAIIKSPKEDMSTDNRSILSNNICYCDDMEKLNTADAYDFETRIKSTKKNVSIGDSSVRLITASCQTELLKKDLNILEPKSDVSSPNCRGNSKSNCEVTHDETYTINSAAIDSKIITTDEDIKLPDNVEHSKSTTLKGGTVRNNIQTSVSTSLEIPDFGEGSLILEIKMLQPLFSIKLKKGRKGPEDTEVPIKQNSFEILEHSDRDVVISLGEESVNESSSKNGVMTQQEQGVSYIDVTTSSNLVNCGVQKTMDHEIELLSQRNEEETSSHGIQTSQICKMESNLERRIEVCLDDSIASTSIDCNELKKNVSSNSKEKSDCLNPCGIGINKFSVNDSVVRAEKEIPQPTENVCDETKSIGVKTLINTIETSLPLITDPIICQKLLDTIKYIRDHDQDQDYSSKEIFPPDQACETPKSILESIEIDMQIESDDNIKPRSQLSITKSSECQKPCKSQVVVDTTNSSKNIECMVPEVKILQNVNESMQSKGIALDSEAKSQSPNHILTKKEPADQILTNGSRAMLPIGEKCCRQDKSHLILTEHKTSLSDEACASETGARQKARSYSPLPKSVSKSQRLEIEDLSNTSYENLVISKDDRSELGENCSHLMSTLNYSSNEISCDVEGRGCDSYCGSSINEGLNITPQLQNYEHHGSSKYHCCYAESAEVDIDEFANMVASQLRGLSAEAALRSQQRMQTLISNSRLESEKNKKHR